MKFLLMKLFSKIEVLLINVNELKVLESGAKLL